MLFYTNQNRARAILDQRDFGSRGVTAASSRGLVADKSPTSMCSPLDLGLLIRFSSSTTFRRTTICDPASNALLLGLTTAPMSHMITLRRPMRSALTRLFRDFFFNATIVVRLHL